MGIGEGGAGQKCHGGGGYVSPSKKKVFIYVPITIHFLMIFMFVLHYYLQAAEEKKYQPNLHKKKEIYDQNG